MTRITQNINNWHVFYILILITFFTSLSSGIINPDKADMAWWSGWLQNFSTEMMGAIATFVLFELVIEARNREEDKQEAIDKEKETLIVAMRSSDKATARNAVAQLSANGWQKDGSLKGVYLQDANLSDTGLGEANLSDAYLVNADLSDADLSETDLPSANLRKANLSGTDLEFADLSGADLQSANLSGANLEFANLRHANMAYVQCDDKTRLPDSTKWTPDTDWTTFGAVVITSWDEWQAYRKEHRLANMLAEYIKATS